MESLFFIIAIITLLYLIFILVEFHVGFKKIKKLNHQPIIESKAFPSVSIILSLLNEENNIESVITSLVNLNYPNLEIIAVNDRSTDKTPEILERLQKKYSCLRVIHIDKLPEGWFGKNHALHIAAQQANGNWLLFTDADVTMKSGTLSKAMSYILENKLDHLTLHEHHFNQDFWLKILLLGSYVSYCLVFRPWRIRYSWSKKFLGRGAFNLINKQVYQQCGGHRAIAMECLDDLKLGKLIKSKGFHQDIVDGQDYVEFKWYSSFKDMVRGLEKNSFAFFNYKAISSFGNVVFAAIFFIWPFFAAIELAGWLRWLNIINIGLTLYISAYVAKEFRLPERYALFYPLGIAMLLYTVLNSVFSAYKHNGVIWRGTHYPLKKLRKLS